MPPQGQSISAEIARYIHERLGEYFLTVHHDSLHELLRTDAPSSSTLVVDIMDVLNYDAFIGHAFCAEPHHTLRVGVRAALDVQQRFVPLYPSERLILKDHISIHLIGYPCVWGYSSLNSLRSYDAGRLMSVFVTVVRVSDRRVVEAVRYVQCTRCGAETSAHANVAQRYKLSLPLLCKQGKCKGTVFRDVPNRSRWMDIQEIQVRDHGMMAVSATSSPHSSSAIISPVVRTVILERELADTVRPGDDVAILCYPLLQWGSMLQEVVSEQNIVLMAVGLPVSFQAKKNTYLSQNWACTSTISKDAESSQNHRFAVRNLDDRNNLVNILLGDFYGGFVLKLALVLVLIGGIRGRLSGDNTIHRRGDSHMLFVGDPSTGKTHLLQKAHELSAKGVFTTGANASHAGLTATAVREGGEWHLEAGALVLSDGGVCCIDDFHTLKDHERGSLLEAMEQQSVSIAKAGIVLRLPARCNVLAACTAKSAGDSVAFSLPLLSRFDLIYILRDIPNVEWDTYFAQCMQYADRVASSTLTSSRHGHHKRDDACVIEQIQNYIEYVRGNIFPEVLSDEIQRILSAYYNRMRAVHAGTAHEVTTRSLEALIRLTQAHARLMGHSTPQRVDAEGAIYVMEFSLHGVGLMSPQEGSHRTSFRNTLHTVAPTDEERTRFSDTIMRELLPSDSNSLSRPQSPLPVHLNSPGSATSALQPRIQSAIPDTITNASSGVHSDNTCNVPSFPGAMTPSVTFEEASRDLNAPINSRSRLPFEIPMVSRNQETSDTPINDPEGWNSMIPSSPPSCTPNHNLPDCIDQSTPITSTRIKRGNLSSLLERIKYNAYATPSQVSRTGVAIRKTLQKRDRDEESDA